MCHSQPIQRALLQHSGQLSIFTDSRNNDDIKRLIQIAISGFPSICTLVHLVLQLTLVVASEYTEDEVAAKNDWEQSLRILIAGMPNVGKSSILNALRRVGVNKGGSNCLHSPLQSSKIH